MSVAENLARVQQQVADAARRAGRPADAVKLMAVTKTHPPERIREAYLAGHRLFGENRVQEFATKAPALADLAGAEFHLIGHLQANKAKPATELFHAVDSLDSLRLARRLNEAAAQASRTVRVLIGVNVGGEEQKSGVAPDSAELEELLAAAPELAHLQFCGLMTVPPFTEDPEGARPCFRQLRELRDRLAARHLPGLSLDELSMGMSHDFAVAIAEGSTCVRVGTAIFGVREAL